MATLTPNHPQNFIRDVNDQTPMYEQVNPNQIPKFSFVNPTKHQQPKAAPCPLCDNVNKRTVSAIYNNRYCVYHGDQLLKSPVKELRKQYRDRERKLKKIVKLGTEEEIICRSIISQNDDFTNKQKSYQTVQGMRSGIIDFDLVG